ncbi:MAG: hypothetical protein ACRDJE_20405 [Dehalococcoidia bacterium]
MQSDTATREQLKAQLAAAGLTLDDERLEALLPVYQGLLGGAQRLAALDLGETEPAVVLRWLRPEPDARGDRS